jgi:hypothetical protein
VIAKIIPRKGRGIAGASALLDYIERDGVKGGDRVAASFDAAGNLIGYTVRGRTAEIKALGESGERRHYISRAPRVDIETGEVQTLEYPIETQGVLSVETAALEFQAVASRSRRTRSPYLHVVVSWRDGEEPTNAEVFASGRHVLDSLGMGEHQYVIAIHRDTDNVHAHIAANRVHPERYLAQHLSMSFVKIDRALRELELRYGWERDRGLHEIRERPEREPEIMPRLWRERETARITDRAEKVRAWAGDRPFTEWVRDAAPALRTALGRAGVDWADVHATLADYNLELRVKGSGFIVVDRNDAKLVAKASHIGRLASRGRLEAVLGTFQEVGAERAPLGLPRTTPASVAERIIGPGREPKTYRRDPNRRADRRDERATAREQLYGQFQKARGGRERFAAAWERQRTRERARYAEITAQKRSDRERLVPHVGALAARTIAAAVAAHQREQTRAVNGREREELRANLNAERTVSWREFVTERALAGDEAAISALRGLRYQAGRERRRSERDGFASRGMTGDPRPRVFDGIGYQVQRSGAVAFYRTSDPKRREIFRDDGWFIAVREFGDAEMTAALRLATEKWGRSITISGSREFKERSLAIAVELGIEVRNRELAERQQQMRHEREGRLRHPAPRPMTRDRDDRDWR